MHNTISRFNHWYDGLPAVPRFLYFIAMMALAIFPLRLGLAFEHAGVTFVGGVLFLLMAVVGVHRAFARDDRLHHLVGATMMVGVFILIMALVTFFVRVHSN